MAPELLIFRVWEGGSEVTLYGYATNPETGERERFVISEPADLDQEFVYAKERRLVEEVKTELRQGRRVQIMWNIESESGLFFLKQVFPGFQWRHVHVNALVGFRIRWITVAHVSPASHFESAQRREPVRHTC
jgi:hypothetical protein